MINSHHFEKNEAYLKLLILTHGITFSEEALEYSLTVGAKGQNNVYNRPKGASLSRPQELWLTFNEHVSVVSCVAPVEHRVPVHLDYDGKKLLIKNYDIDKRVVISFVKKPHYYDLALSNGDVISKYVSACGYDEMNIIPWKGCAIKETCTFCGVNLVAFSAKNLNHARSISNNMDLWRQKQPQDIELLTEAVKIAIKDPIYEHHAHIIIISGNLADEYLDDQAYFYGQLAASIQSNVKARSTEGIIAVMAPPRTDEALKYMKNSGIEIVVFNLEVADPVYQKIHTPGKIKISPNYYLERLEASIPIFGQGKVWCNFVLGLEPLDGLLRHFESLLKKGIVPSYNILHIDDGSRGKLQVPTFEEVVEFTFKSNQLMNNYGYKPFYCTLALRTSMTNEFYQQRIIQIN